MIFKSIAWDLLSQIPHSVSVSVSISMIPFPDSGFLLLVPPVELCVNNIRDVYQWTIKIFENVCASIML